ncbi:MAG TPA: hypothetical protein VLT33_47350, partial [Labilithrix sp.]|nr:hypothetical protein [Labilithrix sp.]
GAAATDTSRADVLVVLRWADDTRRRATLHVVTRDGRETDREVAFAAGDPYRERGRALGYATVAIIPEDLRVPEEAPREPPPAPIPTPPSVPPEQPAPTPEGPDRLWIEATAQGMTAFVGSAGALGGGLAVRLPFGHVALRAGVGARAGDIAEAEASSLLLRADLGVGFWTVVLDPRLAVGARAGLVLFRHSLRRTAADAGPNDGTHTLMGAEAIAEASWSVVPRFALIIGAGPEIAFGKTRVLVGPSQVSVIPPFRLTAEVGARVRF